jgi:2-furoate---CoA ligase
VTLGALLTRAALRRPEAVAVVDGTRRLSYAELDARRAAAARGFARLGVGKRDRVLIALRNRLKHVVAYWALQTLGGVPTPVNFRLASAEMKYVLEDSGAKLALFEDATAPAVLEAARGTSLRLVHVGRNASADAIAFDDLVGGGGAVGASGVPSGDRTPAPAAVVEDDLSLILYTSGTTGRPKGVPRTQKNHYAGAVAHVVQCGYAWGERTLGVMPLYHTMGIHSLTSMAVVNGCFVCQPEWSAAGALRLIAADRLTALYLIPTLLPSVGSGPTRSSPGGRRVSSSRASAPTRPSRDTGTARTPTRSRFATAGTSRATWGTWIPTATSTSPGASTT